jgi:hypothetical protein
MSKLNKTMQELEQQPAVFNLAPLTNDPSCSYIIEISQDEATEYWGVTSIDDAIQTIIEHPFSTATINIGNKIPSIKFN